MGFNFRAAAQGFKFTHEETATGGMKFPRQVDTTVHHPETGEQVGSARYYPPKRRGGPIHIDDVRADAPGAGSAVLNEIESRHPGSSTKFLHQVKRNNNNPDKTGHAHERAGATSDWDTHYPNLASTVHRGFSLRLPDWSPHTMNASAKVVNSSDSTKEQHLHELHAAIPQGQAVGMHWTEDEHAARQFAHNADSDHRTDVPVVLHASTPERKDIETRHDPLYRGGVFAYGDEHSPENEVPIRKGRTVKVTGISWRPDAAHPDADEHGWVHHTYAEPKHHTAALAQEHDISHVYRGVHGSDAAGAAAAHRRGEMGSGMYGKGVYTTSSPDLATGYAQAYSGDPSGVFMHGQVHPDASVAHLDDVPKRVQHGTETDWARENGHDILTDGVHTHIVANPHAVTWDPKDYSTGEAYKKFNRWGEDYGDGPSDLPGHHTAAIEEDDDAGSLDRHDSDMVESTGPEEPEGVAGDETPASCSYCGSTDFEGLTDNGRVRQATCSACGGTMSAHDGAQWTPELIGDPSNHPKGDCDPRSGGVGGAAAVGMDPIMRDTSRLAKLTDSEMHETLSRFGHNHQTGEQHSHREHTLTPVKHAGFKGYVEGYEGHHGDMKQADRDLGDDHDDHGHGSDFDEDLYDDTTPDPNTHERAHYDEHGEHPDSYYERHDEAYAKAKQDRDEAVKPVAHHGGVFNMLANEMERDYPSWHEKGEIRKVDVGKHDVYATQPHVVDKHVNRYLKNPGDTVAHVKEHGMNLAQDMYPGTHRPMFIKHEGNLFTVEGHHRTASALLRKEPVEAHVYDADKHGFPHYDDDEDYGEGFEKHEGLQKHAMLMGADCDFDIEDPREAHQHALRHHDDGVCTLTEAARHRESRRNTKEAAVDGPDWCTWRRAAQCTFPNDRNNTLLAIPQVRGACPWTTRYAQQICPISEPGPQALMSVKGSKALSWDEIGDRHPHVYGDSEIHGDAADGADGPGIGDAANYLAHECPGHQDAEDHSVHDLDFREETVHPRHIDYSPSGVNDPRVRRAREGYRQHPDEMPPLVLVKRHNVYQVADGHHRAEAAHGLDMPVRAYVADSPHHDEPFADGEKAPFHGAKPIPKERKPRSRMPKNDPNQLTLFGSADADYRMQHQAPDADYGAPAHDLTGNGMFPADVYTHPQHYDTGHADYYPTHSKIRAAQGNPEKKVRIYRALPAEHAHKGFNTGDWVSTSKEYARDHGRHHEDSKHDWPVISTSVPAKHLHTEGDLMEWGYNGEHKPGSVAFKGGHHQEVSQRADGSVRPVQRKAKSPERQTADELKGAGYSFSHYRPGHDDEGEHTVVAWDPDENHAGMIKGRGDGSVHHVEIEPAHQHMPLEEHMRNMLKQGGVKTAAMYHWAPKDAREDIAEHGLDHTRSPHFDPDSHGPHGVFMHHNRALADDWVSDIGQTHDLYTVDTHGLNLHPDPYDTGDASYSEHPLSPERLRRESSLSVPQAYELAKVARQHPEMAFHVTAAWSDVRNKAKRIRSEGKVMIKTATNEGLAGMVEGDHGTYENMIVYRPGTRKIADWSCNCEWGDWAWKRIRFHGRQCSHSLALQYEAQSRGMFGREVHLGALTFGGAVELDERAGVSDAPISVIARSLVEADEEPGDIMKLLMAYGLSHSAAHQLLLPAKESAIQVEADQKKMCQQCGHMLEADAKSCPVCNAEVQDSFPDTFHDAALHTASPGMSAKEEQERRKKHHHTVDTRRHAPNFGYGIPGWIGLPIGQCGQCSGWGCGHCGGTGQVAQDGYGNTADAVPDQNGDEGQMMSSGISDTSSLRTAKENGPTVSGVALKAADTNRVLMLQRGLGEDHPAAGKWEFPGGHHEEGDTTSLHAAVREWEEEVGQPFPEGGVVHHTWTSPDGGYQGHVVVIPSEKDLAMHQGRVVPNPDDPKGDEHEQAAWWDIDHAKGNKVLRDEVKAHTPWKDIAKAGTEKTASADHEPRQGEGFDEWRGRLWSRLREHGTPVPQTGHLYRAISDAEMDSAHRKGEFRHIFEGHPLNVTDDPDRLAGGAYGAKGGGHIIQIDPKHVDVGSIRSSYADIDEKAVPKIPMHGVTKTWSWDPEHKDHVLREGMQHEASAWDPLTGEGETPGFPYAAPLHSNSKNPASTGFATSEDPKSWSNENEIPDHLLPSSSYDSSYYGTLHDHPEPALPSTDGADPDGYQPPETHGSIPDVEESLSPNQFTGSVADTVASFQATAGAKSIMAKAPASTPGGGGVSFDFAAAARQYLAQDKGMQKSALKDFSFPEQQELINEGKRDDVRARNFSNLQIEGTHYESLAHALGIQDEEAEDLFS